MKETLIIVIILCIVILIVYPRIKRNRAQPRHLVLTVTSNFSDQTKTISTNATQKIIETTMKALNWNEFQIVILKDRRGNMLDVSGSLYEDGLSSSYSNDDFILLKEEPPESVKEMTQILVDFLKGEDVWRNKYNYE